MVLAMPNSSPLIVSFYAGPGTGKSTTAALVFGQLKQDGYNVELVPEVAKDFTWEERHVALADQAYLAAKQMRNYNRLDGKVEAIITDTSTLLSLIYGKPPVTTSDFAFRDWVKADWLDRRTLDIALARDPRAAYNPAGRNQTEAQAKDVDIELTRMLGHVGIVPYQFSVDRDYSSHITPIVDLIKERLDTHV